MAVLDHYDVQQAGGRKISEYWIPAEDLDEPNANIVGRIDVVEEFRPTHTFAHDRCRRRRGDSAPEGSDWREH